MLSAPLTTRSPHIIVSFKEIITNQHFNYGWGHLDWQLPFHQSMQLNVWCETTPWDPRKWSYMTGGLLSEVQIYRNIGQYYCKSGLSSKVSLLSEWSHQKSVPYHSGLSSEVSLLSQWSLIRGQSLITVVSHYRSVPYHSGLLSQVSLDYTTVVFFINRKTTLVWKL